MIGLKKEVVTRHRDRRVLLGNEVRRLIRVLKESVPPDALPRTRDRY
jgi:hypothetical protein